MPMTTRLQKFIETGSRDEGPFRVAFVLDVSALPPPAKGKEWQRIDSFSAASPAAVTSHTTRKVTNG